MGAEKGQEVPRDSRGQAAQQTSTLASSGGSQKQALEVLLPRPGLPEGFSLTLPWLLVPGWSLWAVDLRQGVPGHAEEVRLHLQHQDRQEGACPAPGADALRHHGGECRLQPTGTASCPPQPAPACSAASEQSTGSFLPGVVTPACLELLVQL